ncbi:hypothetical protein [Cellulomonas sp. NS3]|uniref:hypothetical protein n=1 Tax=Cellulomonas sp. NS3 TaxID=2973977 RepID=UPI002163B97B|nr:hypothetical protein [Cellulomonas sp. NS3]
MKADIADWLARELRVAKSLDASVPLTGRPNWAAGVLAAAVQAADQPDCAPDLIALVTDVASDDLRWEEGHRVFQKVRDETLRLASRENQRTCLLVLSIAESTAKVVYNSSGQPAPFDADSGTVLVRRAAELAVLLDDARATDLLWRAVRGRPRARSAS